MSQLPCGVVVINPADPDVDHPLADLYRALYLSADSNGILYLSREDRHLLNEAAIKIECES